MNQPYVTVIVPCRNEEKYISECLDSLIENDYPKDKLEILVIDGISSDSTGKIIHDYEMKYSFIHVFLNERKIFPSAVNLGISKSKGDLILIVGSHARYDHNYISDCVVGSIKYDADNVGGILITVPQKKNFYSEIITAILSSPFGVGNSIFRTGSSKVTEVDTVFGGCYKRDVFEKIGIFNENLVSTSDYEFNKRLRRNGGKIILIPEIKAYYYTRSSIRDFLINNFRNGYWSIFPLAYVNYIPVSLRHLIPLLFVISLLCSSIFSFYFPIFTYILLSILILYFIAAFLFSFEKRDFSLFFLLPIFFFLLHLTYGLGSLFALIKLPFIKLRTK